MENGGGQEFFVNFPAMFYFKWILAVLISWQCSVVYGQQAAPGAYQVERYVGLLKGKNVAVFANQTSVVGRSHLIDTLQKSGVNIVRIFGPEHGFRGNADAGAHVDSYRDALTGIEVVSLYGSKEQPSAQDLAGVDILVFDLQDVGLRFYTYINSLQHFMEAAIDHDKPLLILDRPNPNGFYVDGPVLELPYKSGVGEQPVPVVYGMTMAEYARMLIGEHWLHTHRPYGAHTLKLTVIPCKNYTHATRYTLPVKPSPNLPTMSSIYWYPSTCFFEGTVLSEGRGTEHPFEIFGHPSLPDSLFAFTPTANAGASAPKLQGEKCYGWDISGQDAPAKIDLHWLLRAYQLFPDKDGFFIVPKEKKPENYFFNKLAGNAELMQQVKAGKTEAEIRQSWQPALDKFKKIRKKYLLYKDF